MFSKPKYGWTHVSIGDFDGSASYITDVPIDVLDAFIDFYKLHKNICVDFDEEGSTFVLVVVSYVDIFVISEREQVITYKIDMNVDELANEIISDFEKYIKDWENFTYGFEKLEVERKVNELKQLVKNRKE